MSIWSYVYGIIEVDTYARSNAEAMYLTQTVVDHLPRIYGSEGDAKFYLNKPYGHNTSSNADEFGNFSNLGDYGSFECQTKILITIVGKLRDIWFDHALKDTTKMLSRLSSRLKVNKCLVSVTSYNKSFIFDDPEWIMNREVGDWTEDLLWRFYDQEKCEYHTRRSY